MRAHKCYDIIPNSSKLIVFDTSLLVSDMLLYIHCTWLAVAVPSWREPVYCYWFSAHPEPRRVSWCEVQSISKFLCLVEVFAASVGMRLKIGKNLPVWTELISGVPELDTEIFKSVSLNFTIHEIEILYQTAPNHGKLSQDNASICLRLC